MAKAVSKSNNGRRQFLRALGAFASVAATAPAPTIVRAGGVTTDEKRKSRYREGEHIKAFYRVNRFPS